MKLQKKKITDLVLADYNPRKISDEALTGLTESIKTFGCVEPIIWNKRTGHVVGGHQRIKALQELGQDECDVIVVDLDETKEKALNVTLNNANIAGEWDNSKLEEILAGLKVELPEFSSLRLDYLFAEFDIGISRPEGERSGSSPWGRIGENVAEGVMLQFGEIHARLSLEIYEKIKVALPAENINSWLEDKLREVFRD